jgi:hypothetical protein
METPDQRIVVLTEPMFQKQVFAEQVDGPDVFANQSHSISQPTGILEQLSFSRFPGIPFFAVDR